MLAQEPFAFMGDAQPVQVWGRGRGHWGHRGRPGKKGGSYPNENRPERSPARQRQIVTRSGRIVRQQRSPAPPLFVICGIS